MPTQDASVVGDGVVRSHGDTSLQSQSLDMGGMQRPNDSSIAPNMMSSMVGPDQSVAMEGDVPLAYDPSSSSLLPGGMTPQNLLHGGMTPSALHGDYQAFTPLDHGMMMTPNHGIDQIESIPNLPVDQVSSILNGPGMDGFSNMGYDDGNNGMSERIANDWNDDYDFPPSVGPVSFIFSF